MSLKNLHPLEVRVLLYVLPMNGSSDDGSDTVTLQIYPELLIAELGFNMGQANQALSWLATKSLIQEVSRTQKRYYELTELGQEYRTRGTPAERIIHLLKDTKSLTLTDIAQSLKLENKDVGSAFGLLSKQGVLAMTDQKQVRLCDECASADIANLRTVLDKSPENGVPVPETEFSPQERMIIERFGKKRAATTAIFRIIEREELKYRLSDAGISTGKELMAAGITGEEIGPLTPQILREGSWKGARFRPYSIQLPPSRHYAGRKNPYCAYLDWVKDKLTSLGFEQFDGPLVETEFWNSDALFMPQFHSARDIHDAYYVKEPSHAREIDQPYLDNVAAAHENGGDTGSRGWGYPFDKKFTRRLILRTQGTVMSAKTLHKAKIPGKYFGILRCFRPDQVDATHLSDFYQTEGIVLGESVSLRTLLGLLKMFATEIAGASEVRYVPGYFPFTEPSVEVHIRHPQLGWFELGGAGIFRPEVTKTMGVNVPVLAWGLGIDRMALIRLRMTNIRELFSSDIEKVRLRCRR